MHSAIIFVSGPFQINEIQRNILKEKYEQIVLHPQYITSAIDIDGDQVEFGALIMEADKEEKPKTLDEDNNQDELVEVLVLSEDYALHDSTEEYEILEVEQSDYNETTDAENADNKIIEFIEVNSTPEMQAIDELPVNEIDVKSVKKDKLPTVGVRRSLRGSARKVFEAKTNSSRQARKSALRADNINTRASQKRQNDTINLAKRNSPAKIQRTKQEDCAEDADEGESGDEFPARDSDNDDWPAQQTISEFPKEILRDGLLQIKGKQLMSMICK